MVVDYERAWIALQAEVASKTQHGRGDLLTRMAELADESRVAAGELPRMLRLYGVEVARAASTNSIPDEVVDFAGGLASPADDDLPGHHDGGHDGAGQRSAGRADDGRPSRVAAGIAG